MAGRGTQRDRDSDDWFADPEPSARRRREQATPEDEVAQARERTQAPATDDWLAVTPATERAPRFAARDTVLLVAAALAVLLLAGLAAAGVFSGGHHRAPATVTTTPRAPTTTAVTTTRTFAALPTSTLKPGDTGVQVQELQRALTALGYSTGAADANYGPATQRAVARFQQASGLTADGIFGAKTLSALNRAAGP